METTNETRNSTGNEDPEMRRRVSDMLSEGGAVSPPGDVHSASAGGEGKQARGASVPERLDSDAAAPTKTFLRWLEEFSQKWGTKQLKTLVARKGRVSESMGSVPENMHRVAAQTRLILELIDDFRDGTYRQISWRSIALLVGATLYAVSPADVIPDAIPVLGAMDDLAVLALVTRLVNKDLRDYCAFKGYPMGEYFRQSPS